jgi:uncharacterized protein
MKENSAIETRCFKSEVRAEKREEKTVVRGYAAMFNSMSENLGGFREIIAPGAFDDVLNNDVRALKNHDSNLILGRTTAGTLRLGVDALGLWYEYDSPDTSYARDLVVSMERGDVDQSSFQFFVDKDNWKEDADGRLVRTIEKVGRLLDVAPVTFPAYPDTTVAKRSMEQIQKQKQPDNTWEIESESRKRKLTLSTINQ